MDGSKYRKTVFTITNTTTLTTDSDLVPLVPGPWTFFRRMRIICAGQIVEDVDFYNRVHEMFHEMKPAEKKNALTILSKALVLMKQNFTDWTKQRLIMLAISGRGKVKR